MKNSTGAWVPIRLITGCRTRLPCLYLFIMLAGCEAPLDLSGVNTEQAKPTHRADLLQAVEHYQQTVIAVGGMGTIVQSNDGGQSWQRTSLSGNPFLIDIAVCPDGSFHAVDKTDGIWSLGSTGDWTRQALPEMTEPQAITCDFSNVIWVTGGFSMIVHSVDLGASWDSWSLDEDLYLTTVQFVDQQNGIVSGEFGTVLLTTDGGENWERANDLPGSFYPQSTYFSSPNNGWVVGLSGNIWKTQDGAQSWQPVPSATRLPLYGITGFGETLVAVGENTTILYYTSGDSSWHEFNGAMKSRTYLRGIVGLDENTFIAAGGGGALFTITLPDHGASAGSGAPDE